MFLLAIDGQLGNTTAAAGKAVRELLGVRPDFPARGRAEVGKWCYAEFVELLTEGWRKGGMDMDRP